MHMSMEVFQESGQTCNHSSHEEIIGSLTVCSEQTAPCREGEGCKTAPALEESEEYFHIGQQSS